jgi:hypothetical protein
MTRWSSCSNFHPSLPGGNSQRRGWWLAQGVVNSTKTTNQGESTSISKSEPQKRMLPRGTSSSALRLEQVALPNADTIPYHPRRASMGSIATRDRKYKQVSRTKQGAQASSKYRRASLSACTREAYLGVDQRFPPPLAPIIWAPEI